MIGSFIKETRIKKGLSLQELADRIGAYKTTIARIEKTGSNPTYNNIMSIFYTLGVNFSDFQKYLKGGGKK